MALTDLIVNKKQITETLIENTLKNRVELIDENKSVHLTKESQKFSNKTKVLLFLCGKFAWETISKDDEKIMSTLTEITKETGVGGSTLRTTLKNLKDSYFVDSDKARYSIMSKGIYVLEDFIKKEDVGSQNLGGVRKFSKKILSQGRPEIIQILKEKSLDEEYVTNIMPILKSMKSTDKFLLTIYIAKEKLGINGLTPNEIYFLLTEPPIALSNKIYVSNISRDLSNLRDYVNPYKVGKAYEYKLNTPGKEYIEDLINSKLKS